MQVVKYTTKRINNEHWERFNSERMVGGNHFMRRDHFMASILNAAQDERIKQKEKTNEQS